MNQFRLITLDPGHFHAALIQKSMYDGVDPRVAVYAPLGPAELTLHVAVDSPSRPVNFVIERHEPQLPRQRVIQRPLPPDPPKQQVQNEQR